MLWKKKGDLAVFDRTFTVTAVLRLLRITVDAEFDDGEFEPVANPTNPVIARVGDATAF